MFDDVRRIGEKVDDLLGTDIFPFNYPFSYTENFLQSLEKWEAAIPMKFLWLVQIESIPEQISSQTMWTTQPTDGGVSSGSITSPGTQSRVWGIDQGQREITKDPEMSSLFYKQDGLVILGKMVVQRMDLHIAMTHMFL